MKTSLVKATALSLVVALTLSVTSPLVVAATANNGPSTDNSATVTAGEVKQALQYTPGVLTASDQSATTSDTDSALVAATAGATIDIPKDASEGVSLAANDGPSIDISLPNADQANDAKQIAPGVVAYSANNGSANAVQATEDGGVRMLTVIDNPKAPTTYDYKVTVPNGGHIELTEDGGAVVLDGNGQPLSAVSAPWAKDARGKQIRTWFTTDGQTLTQHVKHNVRGVVYPVTADPRFEWKWYGVNIYIEQYNVNRMIALMGAGASALAIGTAVTGGVGTPATVVGGAMLAIGTVSAGWCSSKGRGMWIHIRPGITWCNNG